MEQRKFKRFPTNLAGMIILEGKGYDGHIKNVSEEGVGYLSKLDSYYFPKSIPPKEIVTVLFKNTSDNAISLHCEIMWTKGHSGDSSKPFFGLKILNPSNSYKDLVNTLE